MFVVGLGSPPAVRDEVDTFFGKNRPGRKNVRHDAFFLNRDLSGNEVFGDRDLQLRLEFPTQTAQRVKLLDGAFAEGPRAENDGAIVLLQGADHDFGAGGRIFATEHHDGEDRFVAFVDGLVLCHAVLVIDGVEFA